MKVVVRDRFWIDGRGQVFVACISENAGLDLNGLKGQVIEVDNQTWEVTGTETLSMGGAVLNQVGLVVKPAISCDEVGDKGRAIRRAVRVAVPFTADEAEASHETRLSLTDRIAKEILEAVLEEREACARKADGLRYRPCNIDACQAAMNIAGWIRGRSK